jgi:hypothetical protein
MSRIKCTISFSIIAATLGGVAYVIYLEPRILIMIGIAAVVTWAIRTTLECLTSEGE